MNKLFFLISFQFFMMAQLYAQSWNWSQSIGNNTAEAYPYKIFPISNGETFTLSSYYDVSNKIIMTNIDSVGKYTWVKILDGYVGFSGAGMDSQGNIYVCCFSAYEVKYDSAIIERDIEYQTFVMKFNARKELLWIKKIKHEKQLFYKDLYILNDNQIAFCGQFFKNGTRFMGVDILDSNMQVMKQQYFQMDIADYSTFEKLEVDIDKNIYASGYFRRSIVLNDNLTLSADSLNNTILMVKFNENLDVLNGIQMPYISGISGVTAVDNNLFIVGQSKLNYAEMKIYKWNQSLTALTDSVSINNRDMFSAGIANDENGNIYVAVTCKCDSIQFGSTSYQAYVTPPFVTNLDAAILKYDKDFNEQKMWVMGKDYTERAGDFYVFNEDCFLVSGSYSSAEVKFGDSKVTNGAPIINVGYHWLPIYTRKPFVFFASYGKSNLSTAVVKNLKSSFSIFPNPASSYINVHWDEAAKESGRLDVYSIDGRWISSDFIFPGEQKKQLNIENLVPGTYFITLKINENVSSTQWIKN